GNGTPTLTNTVSGAAHALITAGPRDPNTADLEHPDAAHLPALAFYIDVTNGTVHVDRQTPTSKRALASGGGHGSTTSSLTFTVPFSSDVHIFAGRSPLLIIDSCGTGCATIATAVNVSVWDGAGPTGNPAQTSGTISLSTIYVNDIAENNPG